MGVLQASVFYLELKKRNPSWKPGANQHFQVRNQRLLNCRGRMKGRLTLKPKRCASRAPFLSSIPCTPAARAGQMMPSIWFGASVPSISSAATPQNRAQPCFQQRELEVTTAHTVLAGCPSGVRNKVSRQGKHPQRQRPCTPTTKKDNKQQQTRTAYPARDIRDDPHEDTMTHSHNLRAAWRLRSSRQRRLSTPSSST